MVDHLTIGILPDPTTAQAWPDILACLEPAAKRGGVPVLEENELVWVVSDPMVVAAATTRCTVDGHAEVVLVGGTRFREWIAQLDAMIADWARAEGMTSVKACGRLGWTKHLSELGWRAIGREGHNVAYERGL